MTATREELVAWMNSVRGLLRFIDQRSQRKAEIANSYQSATPMKKNWGILAVVLWAVAFLVVLFTVGSVVLDAIYGAVLGPFISQEQGEANQGLMVVLMLALPVLVSVIMAVLVVLFRNLVLVRRQHARAQIVNQRHDEHNTKLRTEEREIDAELSHAGDELRENVLGVFPEKYLYDDAVAYCTELVASHRANSIIEAINLYETEMHRRRIEDMHAAQLAEAQHHSRLQALGNVINAAGHAATSSAVRSERQKNRATNAARVRAQQNKPQRVEIKKPWSFF